MPWAGPVPFAYVSVSPSTSVQLTVPLTAVSSSVVIASLAHTGASLTASTVIETVASDEVEPASLALNVKLSSPFQSASGV